ncbi:MAG: glycoside hydrolase family 15 [Opitutales bacterium]
MRKLVAALLLGSLLAGTAGAAYTPLPTGNGFGVAVVTPDSGLVTHFFAHPYRFERPDPKNPLSEGIETTDFLKSLAFDEPAQPAAVGYVQESHLVSVRHPESGLSVFMPFGFEADALVLVRDAAATANLDPIWAHAPISRKVIKESSTRLLKLSFEGVRETLLVIPLDQAGTELERPDGRLAGSSGWAFVSVENEADIPGTMRAFERWRGQLAPKALVERELAELEAWRVRPSVHFASEAERRLWRQSEVVLRMGQIREPNRPDRWSHGLVVASLGEWFVPWVRDMAYATVAFCRMGHQAEARSAVEAYFNARPCGKQLGAVRGFPYQVSTVRYFGDGSEEPFFTMEGSTNVELDNWGLVLWVLGEYARRWGDDAWLQEVRPYRGSIYASARDFIVTPLLGNLDPCRDGKIVTADTSIWEEHQPDKKHFAFTTAAAILGLREFALLAGRVKDNQTGAQVRRELALLETGFAQGYAATGRLRGTLEPGEKNDVDGAVLSAVNFKVAVDPVLVRNTVDSMEALKVASGGWRRVRCQLTDPSIFEYWYERQEFIFVDLSLAEVCLRLEMPDRAAAISERLVRKAGGDNNLIPEMNVSVDCPLFHGAIGDPTGANPMVGYGAGAWILYLLERENITGPSRSPAVLSR